MARGIDFEDFEYEVKDPGTPSDVLFLCLIRMDKFNVSLASNKINPTTALTVPQIKFHVSMSLNEKQFGLHPRHVVCEYEPNVNNAGSCLVAKPKKTVKVPVLTIAQFAAMEEWDKTGPAQPSMQLLVNHSPDGNAGLLYNIVQKVDEVRI